MSMNRVEKLEYLDKVAITAMRIIRSETYEDLAQKAYRIAEAMFKERNKLSQEAGEKG